MSEKTRYFRISEITAWDVNRRVVQSYADQTNQSFESAVAEAQSVARTYLDNGEGMALPWVVKADSADNALAKYSEEFYCAYSTVVPARAEVEEVRRFEVTRQIDCQDTVVVFAKDENEALDRSNDIEVDKDELEVLDAHFVSATDS